MITSVTSATATATAAVSAWGVALGAGGAILVIGLLIVLELLGDHGGPRRRSLRRGLRVAAAPLLFVFAVSIVARAFAIVA